MLLCDLAKMILYVVDHSFNNVNNGGLKKTNKKLKPLHFCNVDQAVFCYLFFNFCFFSKKPSVKLNSAINIVKTSIVFMILA